LKFIKFILILTAVLLITGCSTAYKSLTAEIPDMDLIEDGVYQGYYDLTSTPIKVKLEVSVQNHQITKIDIIKHSRSPFGKKAEKIIDKIIECQSLDVDAVSGATASSKTILKAVENALQ
jgi:uncharacterized protein with FMN-binding domain